MSRLLRLSRLVERVTHGLAMVAGWATLLMVLIGAYNAIARYLGKHLGMALTSNALVELQWYLFSVVFLLGAPWALRQGAHVRVDILYERLSPKGRAWINVIGTVVLLLPFAALGVWTCWDFAAESIAGREGSNDPDGLARYPIKALLPFAFALLWLEALALLLEQIAFLSGHGPDPNRHRESTAITPQEPATP